VPRAKISAEIADDIVRVNWEKFVFLVGISSALRGGARADRRGARRSRSALDARVRDARDLAGGAQPRTSS